MRLALGRDFRRPPLGGRFGWSWVCALITGCGAGAGGGGYATGKAPEALSPLLRGGSEALGRGDSAARSPFGSPAAPTASMAVAALRDPAPVSAFPGPHRPQSL